MHTIALLQSSARSAGQVDGITNLNIRSQYVNSNYKILEARDCFQGIPPKAAPVHDI